MWAVKFKDHQDPHTLDSAEYESLGNIGNLKDWYLIRHKPTYVRNLMVRGEPVTPDSEITNSILLNPNVDAVEQVVLKFVRTCFCVDALVSSK